MRQDVEVRPDQRILDSETEPQRDVAHLAHARVREEPTGVDLHRGQDAARHDGDRADPRQRRAHGEALGPEDVEQDAREHVGGGFGADRRHHGGHGSRSPRVGVGQPAVKREQPHLDAESDHDEDDAAHEQR